MKKKNILLLILIITMFLGMSGVKALTNSFYTYSKYSSGNSCSSGDYNAICYTNRLIGSYNSVNIETLRKSLGCEGDTCSYLFRFKTTSGYSVFCLEGGKKISGGNQYTFKSRIQGEGIACAVKDAYIAKKISFNDSESSPKYFYEDLTDDAYNFIQTQIWKYEKEIADNNGNIPDKLKNCEIVELVDGGTSNLQVNDNVVVMEEHGDYYIATIDVSFNNIKDGKYIINIPSISGLILQDRDGYRLDNNQKSDSSKLTVTVPKSSVSDSTLSFDLKLSAQVDMSKKITPFIDEYKEKDVIFEGVLQERQNLGIIGLIKESTEVETIGTTVTFKVYKETISENCLQLDLSGYKYGSFKISGDICTDYYTCDVRINLNKLVEDSSHFVNSGQLLLKTLNGETLEATLTFNCYVDEYRYRCFPMSPCRCVHIGNNSRQTLNLGKIENYLTNLDISVENSDLFTDGMQKFSLISVGDDESINVISNSRDHTYTVKYKLSEVYAENITGQEVSKSCQKCKFLGYGKLTKLGKTGSGELILEYKYDFDGKAWSKSLTKVSDPECKYSVEPALIKDDKPQLEFRIIDVNNPFPGKSDTTRSPKTNWNIGSTEIDNILLKKANSYGIIPNSGVKTDAKYVIELTPNDIRDIRNYNSSNDYDNYNFTCTAGGENCISDYLTSLVQDGKLTINYSDKR